MDRKKFIGSFSVLGLFPIISNAKKLEELRCDLKPTCDPAVFIMEQRIDYIKYCEKKDNEIIKIWEVKGICTGIGKCYEGAVNEKPILDCPVNERFKNDCCPLKVKVLYRKNGH